MDDLHTESKWCPDIREMLTELDILGVNFTINQDKRAIKKQKNLYSSKLMIKSDTLNDTDPTKY
jgi:hypothetical protein